MAKRKQDNNTPREDLLQDLNDAYFVDEIDEITRNLPTEEEYMPREPQAAPVDEVIPESINSMGIRMVGRKARSAQEEVFTPTYDVDETQDELLTGSLRKSARQDAEDADIPADSVSRSAPAREEKLLDEQDKAAEKRTKAINWPWKRGDKPAKGKSEHKLLRNIIAIIITVALLGSIVMMLLSRTMMSGVNLLKLPDKAVASSVGPVQGVFSGLVETVADYFRDLKLQANLEDAYTDVVRQNEELYVMAALAQEYLTRLSQYEDIEHEMQSNRQLNPLRCQVIGRDQGNYFATFTIDAGSRQGVEQYMAVTIDGALVGYTEEVYATTSTVRTIIDSDASIAGLIQSSRDQGTVRGTLGVDGTPMCRMYYLPDDHLPRPGDIVVTSGVGMSFPKGIPIGTVRESTRGMESNKQYIVVEPEVDFEHLEYVVVLRYKPAAEAVQGRETTDTYNTFVATVTARPYPTLRIGSTLKFGETPTPAPTASATPSPTPSPTPTVSPTPTATPKPTPTGPVYEYNSSLLGPTATPTPSPTPSPTPERTINPEDFVWEDD